MATTEQTARPPAKPRGFTASGVWPMCATADQMNRERERLERMTTAELVALGLLPAPTTED